MDNLGTCKERAAPGNRIPGLRHDHGVLAAVTIDDDLGEAEDSLLAPESRHNFRRRIELDAESAPEPRGDRLPQLGETLRLRVPPRVADGVDESLADDRVGRLAGIALAEVEDLDAGRRSLSLRLLDADERIRRLSSQNGGDAPSTER